MSVYYQGTEDPGIKSSIIVTCHCIGQHSMVVVHEWEDEVHADDSGAMVAYIQTFDMAFYERGFDSKPTLWHRIKYCLRYLRTGILYHDAISMNAEDAKKLADYIQQRIDLRGTNQ